MGPRRPLILMTIETNEALMRGRALETMENFEALSQKTFEAIQTL